MHKVFISLSRFHNEHYWIFSSTLYRTSFDISLFIICLYFPLPSNIYRSLLNVSSGFIVSLSLQLLNSQLSNLFPASRHICLFLGCPCLLEMMFLILICPPVLPFLLFVRLLLFFSRCMLNSFRPVCLSLSLGCPRPDRKTPSLYDRWHVAISLR